MSKILVVTIACCLIVACAACHAQEVQRYHQDHFIVGSWCPPPLDARADARYKEMADAGFNFVIGNLNIAAGDTPRLLRMMRKYGMKAIINRPASESGSPVDSRSAIGYFVMDEPGTGSFPALAKVVDDCHKAHPGKLAFINLLPDYASTGTLSAASYDEYVARFMQEVKPDVLCMDYYPLFKPDADGRDGYCGNLEVMRKYSVQAGVPFWNFFNIMPYGPHTDPTESQLRWQIFTSVAYGAKGLLYFCYYTPQSPEFPKGGAIIAVDGTRTRHWEEAKRLNKQLANLGPTLMKLTSTGVYRVKPGDDPAKVLKGTGIKNIKRDDWDPAYDYLIGTFRSTDGRRAVMICNYRFAYSAWPTVEFDAPLADVKEIDKATGKEIAVKDDSPDMPGVQISLDDGEGRLFLLP